MDPVDFHEEQISVISVGSVTGEETKTVSKKVSLPIIFYNITSHERPLKIVDFESGTLTTAPPGQLKGCCHNHVKNAFVAIL